MKSFSDDRGVTLVETLVAILIALFGVFSLGSLVFQASATSKNQGTETTRAVIYAQDKTEKLLSLAAVPTSASHADFAACTASAATQAAQTGTPCNTTGISATNWTQGLLAGGSIAPVQYTCPASGANLGYMDFLDSTGSQYDACANPTTRPAYIRQWQITDLAAFTGGPAYKQITVGVYSLSAVNTNVTSPVLPIVVLTSDVSNPN